MDTEKLKREIERHREQAKSSGIDRLITDIYFEHLRYYPKRLKNHVAFYPSITEVQEPQKGVVQFTLNDHHYLIRTGQARGYSGGLYDSTYIKLELLQDGNPVFEEIVEEENYEECDYHKPYSINAFIDGDWIGDFRALQEDIAEINDQNMKRLKDQIAIEEAKKFGISIRTQSGTNRSSRMSSIFERIRRLVFPSKRS